ncbi:MAG: glycosyltransferase family 2 protein [Rhodobacteraceae bacterium]|nr:glycosyltransferase family 2 protein [Paracoccaceae bacterium]
MPCYNEEAAIPILLDAISDLVRGLGESGQISGSVDVLLVDDGSSDATWATIRDAGQNATANLRLRGLRLSRNQGHQRALLAGLLQAEGDVVVSMDADLQDDPKAVHRMIAAWRDGAEIVFGQRASRETDTAFKRTTARAYYQLMHRLGVDLIPDHADYRLMSRKALDALSEFEEENLFLRGIVRQIGFQTAIVQYDRQSRSAGHSKYPLTRMIALAVDGMTSFSVTPLRVIALTGLVVAMLSMFYVIYSIVVWALGGTVPGWASIVVSIYFLGGLHLVALGIIGEYIGKMYLETKRRPRFIIDELTDFSERPQP